jgi:acetyl-CoA acyltransferase
MARKGGGKAKGTVASSSAGRRVAIVQGLRTPFAKSGTAYRDQTALDLGKAVVSELVQRSELDPKEIDLCVFGQVVPFIPGPNIAREIVLGIGLPRDIEAFSVVRACATSIQSMTSAAEHIALGHADVAIAGGADSTSDVPVTISRPLTKALMELQKQKTALGKLRALRQLKPKDFVPVPPAIAEYSTGLTMGQSAEAMAKENRISREAQDAFAHRSHSRTAEAWKSGTFAGEVMHVALPPKFEAPVAEDNTFRTDPLEAYGRLKPVFDREYGSVTAGNSSPLTDGAAALLLMSEEKAKVLGYEPLGYLRSYAYAAVDPNWQLLIGPAVATPMALDKAGLTLKDMAIVDMHEAFAAQVLSCTQAIESDQFARERLGRDGKVGEIDWDTFNVHGGSIALGHPFAATGARLVTQSLQELKRRGGQFSLVTLCAAGGLGAAVVLESA